MRRRIAPPLVVQGCWCELPAGLLHAHTPLSRAAIAGDAKKNGTRLSFAPPPKDWKPWAPVLAAVGDLPIFSQLLGDGQTPFTGPAALIGLDVLAQRRVVLESAPPGAARSSRQRGLLVASK